MTSRRKASALPPLSPRVYSTAQIAAYEGRLPADHPAWSLVPEKDDALHGDWATRQEQVRYWQHCLAAHLVVDQVSHLPTLIKQVTGHDITDSMYEGAWQIRRAVFAWVDSGRAEWANGSLDYFRLLALPVGALVSRPVATTPGSNKPGAGGCRRCGTRWQGEAIAHCGRCHLTFTTVGNFDAHLDGRRNPVPGCRTEAEMRERGYEPNAAGHWRKPMPEGKAPWAVTR